MNIEELNKEYKDKMDELMKEYKDKVKELTDVKEEPFIKKGQRYFAINDYFNILTTKNYCCEDDKERIQIGNCYPFIEGNKDKVLKEVNLIAERRKLQSEMEMFARQNNTEKIDWSNNKQQKWYLYIYYSYSKCEIRINWNIADEIPNAIYFTSKEIAEKALEKFGDRIKKLYLDAEE